MSDDGVRAVVGGRFGALRSCVIGVHGCFLISRYASRYTLLVLFLVHRRLSLLMGDSLGKCSIVSDRTYFVSSFFICSKAALESLEVGSCSILLRRHYGSVLHNAFQQCSFLRP